MNKTTDILGVKFSNKSLFETVKYVEEEMKTHDSSVFQIITANPEIVMQINRDPMLKRIGSRAGTITADGVGILWASKVLGGNITERVTGVELLPELLKMCEANNFSVYLLGSKEETNIKFEDYVRTNYPHIVVTGRRNGYFEDSETEDIVNEINLGKTDFLVIAMGSPREHKWLDSVRDKLEIRASIGVGGAMDSLTGVVKRAPLIVQKLNLEWLYRRFKEPSRGTRQKDLFRFVKCVIKTKITQ